MIFFGKYDLRKHFLQEMNVIINSRLLEFSQNQYLLSRKQKRNNENFYEWVEVGDEDLN